MSKEKSAAADRIEIEAFLAVFQGGIQRYEPGELLGDGGFASVIKCFDRHLSRSVACKVLHDAKAQKPKFLWHLLNEARLLSYLFHPGIVPVHDVFVDQEGHFCYTMNVLEGEDLKALIARNEMLEFPMPLSQALQIFTKICETMAYAHDRGVLHLDIKPANVMIGTYGEVLLLDWGSARLYDRAPYRAFLAESGKKDALDGLQDPIDAGMGSIPFSPIEQMTEERENLRPPADVFSAGVLLFYMLTHTYPYDGDNPEAYVRSLLSESPGSLQALRGDIPPRLSLLCHKMLREEPEDRYQSFHEILADLQEISNASQSFDTQTYKPGQIIINEGEPGDFALQIVSGEVEISKMVNGRSKVVAKRKSGDTIGELAVFSGEPRSATVIALEPTVVKCLTQDQIELELQKLDPWISHMIRELSTNFIALTKEHIAKK